MLNNLLLVFIGGGIGSILRFGTNSFINHYAFSHIGTLVVNVLGSFLFGIIVTIGERKSNYFNLFLLTGLLGGFTTFSTFASENFQLFKSEYFLTLCIYVLSSIFIGIGLVLFGFWFSK